MCVRGGRGGGGGYVGVREREERRGGGGGGGGREGGEGGGGGERARERERERGMFVPRLKCQHCIFETAHFKQNVSVPSIPCFTVTVCLTLKFVYLQIILQPCTTKRLCAKRSLLSDCAL